jgi:hypothetical protein
MPETLMVIDEPEAAYHARTELSSSMLRTLKRSPALLKWQMTHGSPAPSPEMLLGTILHRNLLENVPYRMCEPGEQPDAAAPIMVVTKEQFQVLEGVWPAYAKKWESLRDNFGYEKVTAERTFLWQHPETAAPCRARVDLVVTQNDQWPQIIDLKTTWDPTPEAFLESCARYGYFNQAAWYREGCDALTREILGKKVVNRGHPARIDFLFLAVGTKPPYSVACYRPNLHDLQKAKKENDALVRQYQRRVEEDDWTDPWTTGIYGLPAFDDGDDDE